jgi:hypothetical protein
MVSLMAGRPVAVHCEVGQRTADVGLHPFFGSDFADALADVSTL